jgi:hypothetical protein
MIYVLRCLALAAPVALVVAAAGAQAIPDMTGTWSGTSHSIVMGGGGHHADNRQPADKPFLAAREFTLTVEGQDGRRFWGTTVSNQARERFIGVMRQDVKTFIVVDDDGTMLAEFLAPNVFELCYAQDGGHAGKTLVASCTTFRKR